MSEVALECGVDVTEVQRIEQAVARLGARFLARVYTQAELDYCQGRSAQLAARFAAKEAVGKVLGTGLWRQGVGWHDIEVVRDPDTGKPSLVLTGGAAEHAARLGLRRWRLSLSHSQTDAIAFVIATG